MGLTEEAVTAGLAPDSAARPTRRSGTLGVVGRAARTRRGAVGLLLVAIVVIVAAVGPFVKPDSVTAFVTTPFASPGGSHLLGGDDLGRDVLSRVLAGGWVLLLMSAAATVIGVSVGVVLGILAAYSRGVVDSLVMRTADVFLAFPQVVFALLLVSVVGPKLWLIVIAVAFVHAPQVARVVRSRGDRCERTRLRTGRGVVARSALARDCWRDPAERHHRRDG